PRASCARGPGSSSSSGRGWASPMSCEAAVRARGLHKAYRLYARPRDRLRELLLPRARPRHRAVVALDDVSLVIPRGETVGVIGQNGSGKSTLLQVIAGTLTPTRGTCEVGGKVAALLELGAGFNPEFTGRENVVMNAAILGLSRAAIAERFDAIAAF